MHVPRYGSPRTVHFPTRLQSSSLLHEQSTHSLPKPSWDTGVWLWSRFLRYAQYREASLLQHFYKHMRRCCTSPIVDDLFGLLQPPCITLKHVHSPVSRNTPIQKGSVYPALPKLPQSQNYDDNPQRLIFSLVGGVGCAPVPFFCQPMADGRSCGFLPFLYFPQQV